MPTDILRHLGEVADRLQLVDHHVHGPLRQDVATEDLELLFTESDHPAPRGQSHLDSQVGFALRALCAPVLGLEPSCPVDDYLAARARLSAHELARRFMGASGTDKWLLDTGHASDAVMGPEEVQLLGVGRTHEVVRLESVLESVAHGSTARTMADRFHDELARRVGHAVGLKSIVAYRHGFDFDPTRPSRGEVREAAGRWLSTCQGAQPRVTDPVLLRFLLWSGVDTGLPLQLHAGYGDADVELHRCDPVLLTQWLKTIRGSGSDIVLLHCYPYHRQAGYLAQVFSHVYFDVGLAINYTGASSARIIAESLELAPFAKILHSSDAWGAPELHYLGASLWRRGAVRALAGFVDEGLWSLRDAERVLTMIGRTNALNLYRLDEGPAHT